ncbi:cellulose synthase operon protein YhjQ [Variovorax sp. OK605]|jgi:cellulose synthase operon protein YhjQ|uniref:cellulose biosynthesis protein BcsQ n=1 Tax=unclassified Variovorax TaxID=663243 RepID=UPI0008CBA03D|nr:MULTISPECIES: cellulose biosynthesis protein BcsQ [unclassified Variovorax]SEJ79220.1 cellulose synthase operon protein YhjQ [Variovorax sp. OK202]SFC92283.1 cellulose synthase operon protein YhjQ [Variovorax sp. OK212]SFO53072.1 cellulose synthase operon protein YhjQ [Variovorax sp. OK605]
MVVIPVISSKGGVGKTTIAANLCTALAQRGRQVLAIDLDPQNALRFHIANEPQACDSGLVEAATGLMPWARAIRQAHGGVMLLPFGDVDDERQIVFEQQLARSPNWLAETLARFGLPQGTLVVLDTPPGPTVYLQQALRAAHFSVVTVLADAGSFATLPIVERMLDKYARSRPDYLGTGYVVNQVDPGKRLNHDVFEMLRQKLRPEMLGVLHLDQAVPEALASAVPVHRYAPMSQATQDVASCAERLLERIDAARQAATFPSLRTMEPNR